jgi:hypothetical protein
MLAGPSAPRVTTARRANHARSQSTNRQSDDSLELLLRLDKSIAISNETAETIDEINGP